MSMFDRVSEALEFIPPSDHETRQKIAFAMRSELDDSAFCAFDAWYMRYDRYDASESKSIWQSAAKPGGIKIGTLFYLAKQHGWRDTGEHDASMTMDERAKQAEQRAIAWAQSRAEDQEKRERAAKQAAAILAKAISAKADHPYLVRKGVAPTSTLFETDIATIAGIIGYRPRKGDARLSGRILLVPVYRMDGSVSTLEMIDEEGNKTALKGGSKSGCAWFAQTECNPNGLLMVGEGVATVISAQMATGYPVFSIGSNLTGSGKFLKELSAVAPEATLVLLADLDKATGKVSPKVQEIADAVGAVLVAPAFDDGRSDGQTDFNDLHQAKGLEAVKAQILTAIDTFKRNNQNAKQASEARQVAEFWERHAIVMIEGRACVVYREVDDNTGRHVTRFSTINDIAVVYEPVKLFDGKKMVPLVQHWRGSKDRITFKQVMFKPVRGLVAGSLALPEGEESLNLYQGLTFTPKAGACELIKDHILSVWCSGSTVVYGYVMNWLARMFQVPEERGHAVIVLRSGEGTGKNIIIDMLVQAFGEHALVAVKPNDLVGKFNDALATSVLVFANEAVWGGNKDLEGALKSLITDEELPVERKYIPKYRVRNCVHLMMASNNDWVAPIGLDDRRFVVLDLSEKRKGDHAYFARLVDEIRSGGREALIHELLARDLSGFNPRILPEIEGHQATKFESKLRGSDSCVQWWLECLMDGEIIGTGQASMFSAKTERMNLVQTWEHVPQQVAVHALYDAYLDWCERHKRRIEHSTTFGKKLRDLCAIDRKRTGAKGSERAWVYALPVLAVCRAKMDETLKQRGPWNDTNDT